MKKPNFFIVGAAKSGTTALSEYLRTHPNVFMSTPKEPSYFCSDLPAVQYVKELPEYERLFARATERHIVVCDASPAYLFSTTAIAAIHAYNPDARILVILRNPSEMVPSYHSQLLYSGYESEPDFKKAWALQAARRRGESLPDPCREPKVLQYADIGSIADQLERVYAHFPAEQVLVLFFEELRDDPRATYARVLAFLGLPDDGRQEFPVINSNKNPRSDGVNRLLHSPPRWSLALMRAISGTPLHDYLVRLHGRLKAMNTQPVSRQTVDADTRAAMRTAFKGQVERIEQLTGRRLDAWK